MFIIYKMEIINDYDLNILFDLEHWDDIYNIYENIKEYDKDSYLYFFDKIEFVDFYDLIRDNIDIENSIEFLEKIYSNENSYDIEDENIERLEDLSRKNLYIKNKKNTKEEYK